ncbi:MAG: tetratricopeptide repeat protein [Burkholderiaceae bacterium]|nr:tetratricopeptide repeat protein [Burkholderiaceae bacterium]
MAWLTLVLASLARPVGAADDLIASQLIDQARHWQEKDRDDIAADLWRKVLRADPEHPEALVKLGVIETRAGNVEEAEALYNRARQLTTPPAGLSEFFAALTAVKGPSKNLLPLPTRKEPSKPLGEAAKINPDKRVETRSASPHTIKSNQKAKIQLDASRAEERNRRTEINGLELKLSTSIDLGKVKPRP